MVADVTTGTPITEAWGDSVAAAINTPDIGTGDIRVHMSAAGTLDVTSAASAATLYLHGPTGGSLGARIRLEGAGANLDWTIQNVSGVIRFDDGGTARVEFVLTGIDIVTAGGSPIGYRLNGTPVVGTRKTGWAAASNTKLRTTFDTTTVTLPNLAARVGALIDDLIAHGLIGA